jgi:NAD(P)-dependent dehydrogenase (short-subunit alcohol dehydrogenase family)
VVITGASRGLGLLLAHAFARAGAHVALVARGAAGVTEAASDVGHGAMAVVADVSTESGNDHVVDTVLEQWGGLDVWIGNAGISPVYGGPRDVSAEEWSRVLQVNLTGAYLGARAAMRALQPGGRIILTASVIGERPRRGLAAYAASKAGVIALVKALALDLAPHGVNVNAVSPGWFDSPMTESWQANEHLAASVLDHTALGRWGRSEELAGAYLFLASSAANFVTGSVITVDGGYVCV